MLASYHPSALLYLVLARTAAAVRGGGHGASHCGTGQLEVHVGPSLKSASGG